jgi:pentatricopeptide repeat protein
MIHVVHRFRTTQISQLVLHPSTQQSYILNLVCTFINSHVSCDFITKWDWEAWRLHYSHQNTPIHFTFIVFFQFNNIKTITNLNSLIHAIKHINPLLQIHTHFLQIKNPSLILYNSFIKAYSKFHHFHKAIKLYHAILTSGLKP